MTILIGGTGQRRQQLDSRRTVSSYPLVPVMFFKQFSAVAMIKQIGSVAAGLGIIAGGGFAYGVKASRFNPSVLAELA